MYAPVLVTPPADTPVSVNDVKEALNITGEDGEIERMIGVAVSYLDAWHGALGGRCLISQVWRQDFDSFSRNLRIPMVPVTEIVAVDYDDEAGGSQSVNLSNVTLLTDQLGALVRFRSGFEYPNLSPDKPAVHVQFRVGYSDADAVPAVLRHAVIMLVSKFRSEQAVNPLLAGETIEGVMSLRYRENGAADAVKNLIRPFVVPQVG
jgi:uncharacterized phiE125 gp8 family phage protein